MRSSDAQTAVRNARRLDPKEYTVGWISAIMTEYAAAQAFFDETHEGPEHTQVSDMNHYSLGRIGKHNVVMAVLPMWKYGKVSAANVASHMLQSFPNIRIGLMVGVGGGAPSEKHDVRLGDVVVSAALDQHTGVFQYDFGKTIQNERFQTIGQLNKPPVLFNYAISGLRTEYIMRSGHDLENAIDSILETKPPTFRKAYERPDPTSDVLYKPNIIHPSGSQASCQDVCGSEPEKLEERRERGDKIEIHYGLIASADQLMRDAVKRNILSKEKDVLCFEMEAAGLMDEFPCQVIRGICDYADTHKNKAWQGYAAMTAAAYAKDLLREIKPSQVEVQARISLTIEDVQAEVRDTRKMVKKLIISRQDDENDKDSKKNREILEWLTTTTYGPQQSDCIQTRQADTGQWLLKSNEYQTWLSIERQRLFCAGIPGAGKTILTSIVIEDLCNRVEGKLDIELIQQQKQLPDVVKSLYFRHHKRGTRPSLDEISRALEYVASMYSRVFIVVDALDECEKYARVDFLSRVFSLQASSNASILATSRDDDQTKKLFGEALCLKIHATVEDMQTYLNQQMSRQNRNVFDDSIRDLVTTEIVGKADGMFLLVKLIMDVLKLQRTKGAVKKDLKRFSKSKDRLDTTYRLAMERIGLREDGYPKKILAWLVHAKRPLATQELQHALAVQEPHESELDEDEIPDLVELHSECAGLVTVDEHSNIIRLVHYTAQEYFERTWKDWFPSAESDIAAACVTYLSYDIFDTGICQTRDELEQRLDSNCFYDYAARNWGHHARISRTDGDQCILDLLESKAKVSACAQLMLEDYNDYYRDYSENHITGVHVAAFFGLVESTAALLQRQHNPNMKDSYSRTPMHYAAGNGHERVVDLLAGSGVDPDSYHDESATPLHQAAGNGHEAVVTMLLDKGASPNIFSKFSSGIPLHWAAKNGQTAIAEQLLERGAKIDLYTKFTRGTPLSQAAWEGHEAVARLLLDKGANPNFCDTSEWLPLKMAAFRGFEAIVKLLLEREANIGITGPLHEAAENGHVAVVELLLNKGVDPNCQHGRQGTPLHLAAERGHEAVVEMLIDQGADPNSQDQFDSKTPLHKAAGAGHKAVVKLLLDSGANPDVDFQGIYRGETPLHHAAQAGHEAATNLLLDKGANPNCYYGTIGTPLHQAAAMGHEAVVKLLLDKGANPNVHNQPGGTPLQPLHMAAGHGQKAVVKLLDTTTVGCEEGA
ncbi:hypothetical protein BBP40_012154 [Aspergillus hancockii]|nr:hypothetical protein BBP40_012154 [Aspergillus hancockii]